MVTELSRALPLLGAGSCAEMQFWQKVQQIRKPRDDLSFLLLRRRADGQRRANASRLRLNRRTLRYFVRCWNQQAQHRVATRQKGLALSTRTTVRKISASIRCWFYRISCLRGARCTYLRKLRYDLHRVLKCWSVYASTRQAAAVTMQAKTAANVKASLSEWHIAAVTSCHSTSRWASVVTTVYCSIVEERKREHAHSISRLCCAWKASALLKRLSAMLRKTQVIEIWRDWIQQDLIPLLEVGSPRETFDTVVSKWTDWANSTSSSGCQVIQLRAQSKRARLLSFCRAWSFQARASAARFRVEVSLGVWRVHARLQRSILSYIYKRGAIRARRIVNACLWHWIRGTKRCIMGRQAVTSYRHVLLCTMTRRWASQAKSLVLHRAILTTAALHIRFKNLGFYMSHWRRFWKRKIARGGVKELVVKRILSRTVRKWLSWTRKKQWLDRVYKRKSVRVIHTLPVMMLRWLQHTRSKQACSRTAQSLMRMQRFRFAKHCMAEWVSCTRKILFYTDCCGRIEQMRFQNLRSQCFLAMANAVLRCKRHCAIQVLIARSNIAATLKRGWFLWCHEVQINKLLHDHLMSSYLTTCHRIINDWSSTAKRSSLFYQRLTTLDRKFTKSRRQSFLYFWHRVAKHQRSIRNKCSFARRKVEDRLKFSSFYDWSRCVELQHVPANSSGLDVWKYINKVVLNREKAQATGLCARVTAAWKQTIFKRRSLDFALSRIGRRQQDAMRILTFYHWILALSTHRHRWRTFERMRSRNASIRLCQAFQRWIDVVDHRRRSNLHCKRRLLTSNFGSWKAFSQSCLRIKYVLNLMAKDKTTLIQRDFLLSWRQHVDNVCFTLRTIQIGKRQADRDTAGRCFMLWVQALSDSKVRAKVDSVDENMKFVHAYIIAKQQTSAFRVLRASFFLWCDRIARRRILEDWTIHIYAKKRLRRIEKNACSQYLQRLLARVFLKIGHWVHEKRKMNKKLGELRGSFACTSVLAPPSPPMAGELSTSNLLNLRQSLIWPLIMMLHASLLLHEHRLRDKTRCACLQQSSIFTFSDSLV